MQSAMAQGIGLYPVGTGEQITLPQDSPFTKPAFTNLTVTINDEHALPAGYRPLSYIMNNPELDYFFMQDLPKACPHANDIYVQRSKDMETKYDARVNEISNELTIAGFDARRIFNKDRFAFDDIAILYDEFRSYRNYYGMNY